MQINHSRIQSVYGKLFLLIFPCLIQDGLFLNCTSGIICGRMEHAVVTQLASLDREHIADSAMLIKRCGSISPTPRCAQERSLGKGETTKLRPCIAYYVEISITSVYVSFCLGIVCVFTLHVLTARASVASLTRQKHLT